MSGSIADVEKVSNADGTPIGGGVTVKQGTITDRSGTIATGGTAQPSTAVVNASRRYLLVQNPTSATASFWISFSGTAVQASPSIEVAPGVTLTWEGSFVPTQGISVIGPATGQVFTIKEG